MGARDIHDKTRSRIFSEQQVSARRTNLRKVGGFIIPGLALTLLASLTLLPLDNYIDTGSAVAAGPQNKSSQSISRYTAKQSASSSVAAAKKDLREARLIPPRGAALPNLEKTALIFEQNGEVSLASLPEFKSSFAGKFAAYSTENSLVYFTLDQELQNVTKQIVGKAKAPHVAVVTMNPRTGEVLSIAEKSTAVRDLSLYSGFPAASLFKLVTSAAALEKSKLEPLSPIRFRGGTYTLNQWNYKPNPKSDRRSMTLAEALGKSCNAVFGRVALSHLSPQILRDYSTQFGFNNSLHSQLPLSASNAFIPQGDFELSRTAAGFGDVTISPVHAAALMSGIANGGFLPKPLLVESVVSNDGQVLYRATSEALTRIMQPATSKKLLQMMEYTTTIGTSRKEFSKKHSVLRVAAKTGTLTGTYPEGVNHWFIAAAPIENPQIAVAVIVVNPRSGGTKASQIGKAIFDYYFKKK